MQEKIEPPSLPSRIESQIETPLRADEPMVRAIEAFNEKDYKKAAELLESQKADSRANLLLGLSYYKLGEYEKAIDCLEESLYHKEEFVTRKILAYLYYKQNNFEKSILNAEKGLALNADAELQAFYGKIKREEKTEKDFVKEGTSHFTMVFDGYSHGEMSRRAIYILEEAYKTIGWYLEHFPSEPVTVILYTDREFYDITQKPLWTQGLYDGKIRIPIKGARMNETTFRKVLFHEYTHSLLYSMTNRLPNWMNEGLAEYFSEGDTQTVGQIIPLKRLEGNFSGLRDSDINIAYRESYSAVKYLIDKNGLYSMKKFLALLSENHDFNEAFSDAFYIGYDEFVSQWGKG